MISRADVSSITRRNRSQLFFVKIILVSKLGRNEMERDFGNINYLVYLILNLEVIISVGNEEAIK